MFSLLLVWVGGWVGWRGEEVQWAHEEETSSVVGPVGAGPRPKNGHHFVTVTIGGGSFYDCGRR